jgi:hypothetical protein
VSALADCHSLLSVGGRVLGGDISELGCGRTIDFHGVAVSCLCSRIAKKNQLFNSFKKERQEKKIVCANDFQPPQKKTRP